MNRYIALFTALGIVLLAACGIVNQQQPDMRLAPVEVVSESGVANSETLNRDQTAAVQTVEQRIVLKNASLTLVVSDAETAIQSITALAETMGGWVVTSNSSKAVTPAGREVIQGAISIRVPSARFNEAVSQIKVGALSVDSENVTGQDVTQDYVDLTSQLNNLSAAETQLQAIMEGARNTDDVLTVYNELVRVRGEIETTQGRIRYYEESAAFSSITANLIPEAIETPIQIAGWSPGRTAENALASLVNVLRFAADLLISLALFIVPLILIFGVPGWFIYRTLARRGIITSLMAQRNMRSTPDNTPPDE